MRALGEASLEEPGGVELMVSGSQLVKANDEIRKRLNENENEIEDGRRIKALLTGMFSWMIYC